MHPVSCTNTHHGVTDFINHGMGKNIKASLFSERNITFPQNKKILNLYLKFNFYDTSWEVIVL